MASTLHETLAANLRAERARRGWTQAHLAGLLGWPRTAISDAELGQRRLSLDDLAALCDVFGIDLAELARGGDGHALRALGLPG